MCDLPILDTYYAQAPSDNDMDSCQVMGQTLKTRFTTLNCEARPRTMILEASYTKKLALLYDDDSRIAPEDVSGPDRTLIRSLLASMAMRDVTFVRPVRYETASGCVWASRSQTT